MKACFRRQKELEEKWWEKRSAWAVEKYKRNRKRTMKSTIKQHKINKKYIKKKTR